MRQGWPFVEALREDAEDATGVWKRAWQPLQRRSLAAERRRAVAIARELGAATAQEETEDEDGFDVRKGMLLVPWIGTKVSNMEAPRFGLFVQCRLRWSKEGTLCLHSEEQQEQPDKQKSAFCSAFVNL